MVIIDYLQLMQGTGNKDRHQEVSDISRGLKMLAREMKNTYYCTISAK